MAKSRAPNISLRPFTGAGTSSSAGSDVLYHAHVGVGGSKFKIKLTKARIETQAQTIEATPELTGATPSSSAVTGTVIYPLGMERGRALLQGHVVGGGSIGLTNIVGNAQINVSMTIGEDSSRRNISFKMVPEAVTVDWDYTQPFVGISISGPMTNEVIGSNSIITES
tara:strand:+ start:1492 stop:1995 length:504 start_codon:yes stop_codon:yes gene_type:complete